MRTDLRVVHYLNQFFGGMGGEEKASEGPQLKVGAVGLGSAIQDLLKDRGEVVATIICGDNYFTEKTKQAVDEVLQLLIPYKPDILFAGPAFNAGRYGVACGEVCTAVQDKLGIPAVTGMYEENPGLDLYRRNVYIVKTTDSVRGTAEATSRMVTIALKLIDKEKIGKPAQDGYFSRGIVRNERSVKTAAERAVSMVLVKIKKQPFEPELETPKFDRVKPPAAIKDLHSAKICLATDGGLVPKGNPDKLASHRATRFGTFSIKGLDSLRPNEFEANHIGYDTCYINQDPNRLVPLDVMRDLEKGGVIRSLHNNVYTLAGVATTLDNSTHIGIAMAKQLRTEGVDGVIFTST